MMNIIKGVARKSPKWMVAPIMNFIMARRFDVKIGKGSMVRIDCIFEGFNAVFDNTVVARSLVGKFSYIANHSVISSAKIGRFCSIGDHVRTELGRHPTKTFVSSHPAFFTMKTMEELNGVSFVDGELFDRHLYIDDERRYVVEIGNDVWIGNNVLIMDGIHIGDGAVVAAGAVVAKDVPPYCIVGGVPAKPIRYRFSDEEIQCLLKSKWWDRDVSWIQEHAHLFTDIKRFVAAMRQEGKSGFANKLGSDAQVSDKS